MKLASLLSAGAQICQPGSECFQEATDRWCQGWAVPSYEVIVKAATAEDVQNLIRYANERQQPFFAITGKHGATSAMANVKNGIGIYMRGMNSVDIADDGESAIVEGGVTSKELLDYLWPRGKQGVIGGCECTGITSPMLGGGHGFLAGQYGLISDNLISANLVLANGTAITVSESQHEDLFWGLRGAGQNFGIVTSFSYRIYDRSPDTDDWAYENLVFPNDKLQAVYEVAERIRQTDPPVELGLWGMLIPIPDIDPDTHSLIFTVYWQGPSVPSNYTAPFLALNPLSTETAVVPFPGFAKVVGLSMDSFACTLRGPAFQSYPVNLEAYNPAAIRKAVEILDSAPPEMRNTPMLIEGYSVRGVQRIPEDATAFPDRSRSILISPFISYPKNRTDLVDVARDIGTRFQNALVEGSGERLYSYVNYATGFEDREALYGYEPWRLEKLRRLKAEYDPHGRFDYYVPLNNEASKKKEKDEACETCHSEL